jgi:CBS domain-containing protein
MKLREVMSCTVLPVGMNDFVDDAAWWMAHHGITCAPVLDRGHLVGLICASHLQLAWLENELNSMRTFFGPARRRRTPTVREVMVTPVVSLTPGADIAHAAEIFHDPKVPCILIVDGVSVLGMVNRQDIPRDAWRAH